MVSSEESIAELKEFLEGSQAGLTATVTLVEVSDNSDGDGDMSEQTVNSHQIGAASVPQIAALVCTHQCCYARCHCVQHQDVKNAVINANIEHLK